MAWCKQQGGEVQSTDMVQRIAQLGTEGKWKANVEQDFHTLLNSFQRRLGAKLTHVQARMFNHNTAMVEWQPVPCLMPDDFAEAIFNKSEDAFHRLMIADVDACQFWGHYLETSKWFQNHSLKDYPRKDRLIACSIYGDEVQCYKNSEVGTIAIIGWCADFGYTNPSVLRYWPIAAYSEHSATPDTHEDIMKVVTERLRCMTDPTHLYAWSSSGYCFLFNYVTGDLKWVHGQYGLHNYRRNDFCSLCGVRKVHDDAGMTLAAFHETASHVGTAANLEEFTALAPSIFTLPHVTPERVLHDPLHSQLLGTGKLCNGGAIVFLCESSFWNPFQQSGQYPDALAESLRLAHRDFLAWKKQGKYAVTQPRFTPARLARKSRQNYPCLSCKGAASKAITRWITERVCDFASRPNAGELAKLVATCMYSYNRMLEMMDECELLLCPEEADQMHVHIMTHLQTCALLNKLSREIRGKAIGRNIWMLCTKHHHLQHCAQKIKSERINPRSWALFAGEDFVGRMSRIAAKCHRSSLSLRVLHRYMALIYLALPKSR